MYYLIRNFLKIKFWIKGQKEVRYSLNRILWSLGSPDSKLKPVDLELIFPGKKFSNSKITVINYLARERGESLELEELIVILTIVKETSPTKILEIGTFEGNTTLNLAANIAGDGRVVTIDLPSGSVPEKSPLGRDSRGHVAVERRQFIGCDEDSKITQVYGDSTKLDMQGLGGPFDLIFIDADHSSYHVFQDTINALSALKPGGIIIWHDYEMKSVSLVIDSAAEKENLFWIKGTRLAIGFFENPKTSQGSFSLN